MGKLTVTFAGICTHFKDVVPGVPHRVVLPDAAAFRFGVLRWDREMRDVEPAAYYLQPHFAVIKTGLGADAMTVPNVMRAGYLYAGAHLKVHNAHKPLIYEPSYDSVKSVGDFVENFRYAEDVVTGGRATCYFDVHNGHVTSAISAGGAIIVVMHIETEGEPVLMLTPFEPGAPSFRVPLIVDEHGHAQITIANAEFGATEFHEDTPFDFLLHYLTAQRGIPDKLTAMTPGLNKYKSALTAAMIEQALASLAQAIAGPIPGPTPEQVRHFHADILDPSCSDSRYP